MNAPLAAAVLVVAAKALQRSSGPSTVWGYVAGKPTQLQVVDVGRNLQGKVMLLRLDAADAWVAMRDAAAAEGVLLQLNSAFRTWDEQKALRELYEAGQGAYAAEPGYSDHQGAVAVDVETEGGTNRAFFWLGANASRFHFKRTVAGEPWHWEFFS